MKTKTSTKQKTANSIKGAVSGSDLVKTDWNLRECFKQLRFDKNHHLGLGDIRITIAQQDEICDLVERFYHCRQPAVMPSLPNGKRVLSALKELSDCFTDEERKTMFGNKA